MAIITFFCSTCGEKNYTFDNHQYVNCSECDTRYIIIQSGGTVTLRPVTQTTINVITQIPLNTSEAEIDRLTKEIKDRITNYDSTVTVW